MIYNNPLKVLKILKKYKPMDKSLSISVSIILGIIWSGYSFLIDFGTGWAGNDPDFITILKMLPLYLSSFTVKIKSLSLLLIPLMIIIASTIIYIVIILIENSFIFIVKRLTNTNK